MKTMLLGLAAMTIGLMPTTLAASPEPVPAVGNAAHDPHHGWYVHYHHRGHHHVAGPFRNRHEAEDHADHLRHRGYHVERIVRK